MSCSPLGLITRDRSLSKDEEQSRYGRISGLVNLNSLQSRRCTFVGMGSMGQPIASQLARHGVATLAPGRLRLIDGDKVEARNLIGTDYRSEHLGLSKASAAASMVREINDQVNVSFWDRMLIKDDLPAIADMARRSDLLGLFADDFEVMLAASDLCDGICPQVMAIFGPRADFAEVAFSIPGVTPPLAKTIGRRKRTALTSPSALGCDTLFVSSFVAGLCIRLLLGDAKGSELFACYANAPLFVVGLRKTWILENQPPDVARSIMHIEVQQRKDMT